MKCIACREEIPDRAKICSKCQSYQRAWKNHLKFFGALAGLVVLLLSASTYITTEVSQWLKEETWTDKIEVLDFSITNESSLLNSGDGDIFISTTVPLKIKKIL